MTSGSSPAEPPPDDAPRSTAAGRAQAVFPGGSLGEYDLPPELGVVLAGGTGATVWDTEGRRFYLSLAHTEADVARLAAAAREALADPVAPVPGASSAPDSR